MSNGLAGGIESITRYYQMLELAKQQAKLQEAADERREAAKQRAWAEGGTEGIAPVRESRLPEPGSLPPLRDGRDLPSLPLPRFDPFAGFPEVRGGISAPPGAERVTTPEGYELAAAKALQKMRLDEMRMGSGLRREEEQFGWGRPLSPEMAAQIGEGRRTESEERERQFKQYHSEFTRDLLAQLRPQRLKYQEAYGWTGGKREALKEAEDLIEMTREDIQAQADLTDEQKSLMLADLEAIYARYFPQPLPSLPSSLPSLPSSLPTREGLWPTTPEVK